MNIHEYQAKELFEKFGVPSPSGRVAESAEEAKSIAAEIGGSNLVVKAQVHAGGRGKGTFKNGFQGGVHLCKTADEIGEIAGKMIGETLVTHQTGEAGRLVRKVMVAEAVDIDKEYYLAILMDRESRSPVIVASTEGGMDIEAVAEETPEKILRQPVLGRCSRSRRDSDCLYWRALPVSRKFARTPERACAQNQNRIWQRASSRHLGRVFDPLQHSSHLRILRLD